MAYKTSTKILKYIRDNNLSLRKAGKLFNVSPGTIHAMKMRERRGEKKILVNPSTQSRWEKRLTQAKINKTGFETIQKTEKLNKGTIYETGDISPQRWAALTKKAREGKLTKEQAARIKKITRDAENYTGPIFKPVRWTDAEGNQITKELALFQSRAEIKKYFKQASLCKSSPTAAGAYNWIKAAGPEYFVLVKGPRSKTWDIYDIRGTWGQRSTREAKNATERFKELRPN